MKIIPQESIEQENAQILTIGMLMDVESATKGDPEKSMIIGNSMIAAAKMLLSRAGIDEKQRIDLYREFWQPLVIEGVAG